MFRAREREFKQFKCPRPQCVKSSFVDDCQNDNDRGKQKYSEQNSSHCQYNESKVHEILRSYLAENRIFLTEIIQLTYRLIIKYSVRKLQVKHKYTEDKKSRVLTANPAGRTASTRL